MAKPKAKSANAEVTAEQVIYLGPSMLERDSTGQATFQINYGTVYSNGIPADVTARQKSEPDFARLFVPVSKAAKTMMELGKPTSALAGARAKVAQAYQARQKRS